MWTWVGLRPVFELTRSLNAGCCVSRGPLRTAQSADTQAGRFLTSSSSFFFIFSTSSSSFFTISSSYSSVFFFFFVLSYIYSIRWDPAMQDFNLLLLVSIFICQEFSWAMLQREKNFFRLQTGQLDRACIQEYFVIFIWKEMEDKTFMSLKLENFWI